MNGSPENTPTESGDPISYILDNWIARASGLVSDVRKLRHRIQQAGQVELGAIAVELAAVLESAAPATPEAARLLRQYARREAVTERDLRAAPRARRKRDWYGIAKVTAAIAALITAAAAAWSAIHP